MPLVLIDFPNFVRGTFLDSTSTFFPRSLLTPGSEEHLVTRSSEVLQTCQSLSGVKVFLTCPNTREKRTERPWAAFLLWAGSTMVSRTTRLGCGDCP